MNRMRLFRIAGWIAAVVGVLSAITAVVPASAATAVESHLQLRVPAPGHSVSWTLTNPLHSDTRNVVLSLIEASGTALQGTNPLQFTLFDSNGVLLFKGGTADQLRARSLELGGFPSGTDLRVEVRAELPEAAGNEYRTAQAELTFRFDSEKQEQGGLLANTGVNTSGALWIALGFVVVAILLMLAARQRNKKEETPGATL